MSPMHSLLTVQQLRKSYLEGEVTRTVFEHLDLTIRCGEFVALLGPSGCGKSTLLNLISGIDLPDAGEIIIGGQSITLLSERERTFLRRRHIGFVFQFFNLIPTLTVEENLFFLLEINNIDSAIRRQEALSLLEQVGLANRRNSFPERLSGGEQQRLAIVRALAHEPRLLLADEPTGNLDMETGNRVLDLLFSLPRQTGTTVLVVTHSPEIAARADRVLRLREGRIREEGA